MSPRDEVTQNPWFFLERFLEELDPYVLLIHEEQTDAAPKLVLRFQNGFGVEILQAFVSGERAPFFRVLVLRFMGASMQDFKPVAYLPVPQVNWIENQDDLMQLCQQVAEQPGSWAAAYKAGSGLSATLGH